MPANTPSPIGRTESFLPGNSNSAAAVGETCSTAVPLGSDVVVLAGGETVAFSADSEAEVGLASVELVEDAGGATVADAWEEVVAAELAVELEAAVEVGCVAVGVAVAELDTEVEERTITLRELELVAVAETEVLDAVLVSDADPAEDVRVIVDAGGAEDDDPPALVVDAPTVLDDEVTVGTAVTVAEVLVPDAVLDEEVEVDELAVVEADVEVVDALELVAVAVADEVVATVVVEDAVAVPAEVV